MIPSNKKGSNGKHKMTHLGYKVFLFQTAWIKTSDNIPNIGYTSSLKLWLMCWESATALLISRWFSMDNLAVVAMARKAPWTTPKAIKILPKQTIVIVRIICFEGVKAIYTWTNPQWD